MQVIAFKTQFLVHIIDCQSKWNLLLSLSIVQEQGKACVGNYSWKILREIPSKKNGVKQSKKIVWSQAMT